MLISQTQKQSSTLRNKTASHCMRRIFFGDHTCISLVLMKLAQGLTCNYHCHFTVYCKGVLNCVSWTVCSITSFCSFIWSSGSFSQSQFLKFCFFLRPPQVEWFQQVFPSLALSWELQDQLQIQPLLILFMAWDEYPLGIPRPSISMPSFIRPLTHKGFTLMTWANLKTDTTSQPFLQVPAGKLGQGKGMRCSVQSTYPYLWPILHTPPQSDI